MKRLLLTLAAGCFLAASASAQQPTDLLISEYIEGSSFNKAVELYNGTNLPIDLDAGDYLLRFYFNGNTSPGTTIDLTGVVAPGDVFVVAEDSADPAILAEADQLSGASFFNGNDAVVLFRDSTVVVDAIGQVGFDPGEEWGTGDTSTKDNTLIRRMDDCTPDDDASDPFDPATHYAGFPQDTFANIGEASLDCGGGGPAIVADIEPAGAAAVPASGGPIAYTVTLANNTSSSATFTAVVNATLPGGSSFGPVKGPRTVTLAPGQTLGPVSFTSEVPAGAPVGDVHPHPHALGRRRHHHRRLLHVREGALTPGAGSGRRARGLPEPVHEPGDVPVRRRGGGRRAARRLRRARPRGRRARRGRG